MNIGWYLAGQTEERLAKRVKEAKKEAKKSHRRCRCDRCKRLGGRVRGGP